MLLHIHTEEGLSKTCEAAKQIREAVFVQEQLIPRDLEFDDQDASGIHYVGYVNDQTPVTTARIHHQNNVWHVGRVATIKDSRGQGFAKQLMMQIMTDAKVKGVSKLTLGAQIQASDFYKRLGFVQVGDVFMEAGIEHIEMTLIL